MPLSESALAQELEAAVDALASKTEHTDYKQAYYRALATAIISHIKQNASVDGGVCADGGAITGGKIS